MTAKNQFNWTAGVGTALGGIGAGIVAGGGGTAPTVGAVGAVPVSPVTLIVGAGLVGLVAYQLAKG